MGVSAAGFIRVATDVQNPDGSGRAMLMDVQTLTPSSPLGRALLGLSQGDEAEVATPQGTRIYDVLSVA